MITDKEIFEAIRLRKRSPLTQAEVNIVNSIMYPKNRVEQSIAEPAWIQAGRTKIGEKEIAGPKHNAWILSFWKQTPWLKTDDSDSPWCGGFVKWCLEAAGLDYPKEYPRAISYATWGTACPAQVGAIGVKARKGGNHVFFIVGITADRKNYKVLEGNANNMVRIGDIPVSQVNHIRWPAGVPLPARPDAYLPVMAAGIISSSEG